MNTDDFIISDVILNILIYWHETDAGWWYGHDTLKEQIADRSLIIPTDKQVLKCLRFLKDNNKIITLPIYKDNGKLNGSGWFYNPSHR